VASKKDLKVWDESFTPYYSPFEMLKIGIFEGKYINDIKGLPDEWYDLDNVLSRESSPDNDINRFKVKARQSLSVWKANGWIKTDPEGWFGWYIHYFHFNRRLEVTKDGFDEDKWQIDRWNSFVSRMMGGLEKDCKLDDLECSPKRRQNMLQWAWNAEVKFNETNKKKALKALAKKHPDKIKLPAKSTGWKK